jgi:hypothetical protein
MQPLRPEQYPNWREVYSALAPAPQHRDNPSVTDELLAAYLGLLHDQCMQLVQARGRYYASLKAYIEQEGRPADQQAFVENAGAASLKAFSQSSGHYLQLAMLRSVQAQREEVRQRPVSIHTPPQPQSLRKRLLGR